MTNAQTNAISEIKSNQESDKRMLRMLQGDVGSGKTLVALAAMLHVVESGAQAALLVPTEVLARQHHQSLNKMLEPIGKSASLLLGQGRAGSGRKDTLSGLQWAEPSYKHHLQRSWGRCATWGRMELPD